MTAVIVVGDKMRDKGENRSFLKCQKQKIETKKIETYLFTICELTLSQSQDGVMPDDR